MKKSIVLILTVFLLSISSFSIVNEGYESPIVNVVEEAAPAVVNIESTRSAPVPVDPYIQDFFERFFGQQMPEYQTKGVGSGFIFDKRGYILTNYHVIDSAEKISVSLPNGKDYDAELVGGDEDLDLAIIKISADEDLPTLPLGDSDKIRIGEDAIAIGNPLGLQNTVTAGVISATNRSIPKPDGNGNYVDLIQTDATINPGNSGGPLLNIHGEVIGINTAIAVDPQLGSVNIGFAIPINIAKRFADSVMETGTFQRAYLGVYISDITEELKKSLGLKVDKGAYVQDLVPGGAAEKAGIKANDVIVEVNGKKIENTDDLTSLLATYPAGNTVEVVVDRFGERITFNVTLGSQTPEVVEAYFGIVVRDITSEDRQKYSIRSSIQGVIVEEIQDDTYALGLRAGDVITEIAVNGVYYDIQNVADWEKIASSVEKNSYVALIVYRNNVRYVVQFFYR
ncbi:serine protease [Petrotoga sp. HWH.PT.55.6.1]|jgi:Do/DeqQ family serine protease|uniref:Do family serine endopeptidase n=1 Tax=unclassified Petrotoga TaxID=2620614 RepID=UPI000CA02E71|nr:MULTISPECIES: Do family serine endopeptidase [unclassified Petrotoga]PNR93744.1 serine protease [Petrotoga sp. HWHPT.55.6.3]RPD36473.1 serine protease [Petrotoga sp. HWH.PT.55.6.1]